MRTQYKKGTNHAYVEADYAEQYGIALPELSEQTKQGLRSLLPALGPAHNPLDTTGAVVNDLPVCERIVAQVGSDPHLDVLVCAHSLPSEAQGEYINAFHVKLVQHMVAGLRSASHPVFLLDFVNNDVAKHAREAAEQNQWPLLPGGVDRGLQALGKAMWWSERFHRAQAQQGAVTQEDLPAPEMRGAAVGPWSESQIRPLLAQYGIPVVPALLVTSAEQAECIACHSTFHSSRRWACCSPAGRSPHRRRITWDWSTKSCLPPT